MRKFFTNTVYTAIFLLFGIIANAQVTGQYRTIASGDWTSLSTWERYNGTAWATPVHTPNYLDGITTIRAGYTVTLPAGSLTTDQLTIESGGTLTLQSGSNLGLYNGAGTDFTCNGILDMLDGSTISRIAISPTTSISGTVKVAKATVDAPLVINGGGFLFLNDGSNINDSIYNNNVTTITSGQINFSTGVFINNDSVVFSGAGPITCTLQKVSGVNSFINNGSMVKDGIATAGVTLNATINLTSTGTIDLMQLPAGNSAIINSAVFINSGTLRMYDGATGGSVSITNQPASVVTITSTSTVSVDNPASDVALLTNSGTISLNIPLTFPANTTTSLLAGSVIGNGSLTINGVLNHNGGSVSVPLTLGANTTYNINSTDGISLNANVNTSGIVNWVGGDIHMGNNAIFRGSTAFNVTGDNTFDVDIPGSTSVLINGGTFTKSSATGITTFGINVVDSGVVNINTGTIKTTGQCSFANLISFTSGTTLQNDGTIIFNPFAKLKGTGAIINNGTITANLNLKMPKTIPFTNNGNISGTGTLKVPGTFIQGGGIISVPVTISGDCTISGPGVTFNAPVVNKGTINWNAGNITINNTTFTISKNKNFNINTIDFTEINGTGTSLFTNSGVMVKSLNTTTTITIPLTNTKDGQIEGIGWYQMLGTFTNGGTVDPGVGNFGRLVFTGNPTSATSIMRMQIKDGSANSHDAITVDAGTAISGTLTLTQVGSSISADTIVLISASSGLTGTFTTVNKPDGWEVLYTSNTVAVIIPALKAAPVSSNQNDAITVAGGSSQLKFYPNPVKDVLFVQLPAATQKATINILSIDGKLMQRISSTQLTTRISIAALPKGTYLLQVVNGSNTTSQKFIKD